MLKALTLAGFMAIGTLGVTLSLAHAAEPAVVTSTTTTATEVVHEKAAQPKAPHHMGRHDGPCAAVFDACKSAGYTRGGMATGKGLMENCIKPLDAGQVVAGVTIDKAQVDACKTHHAAKKAEFDAKMKNDPEFAKKMQERKAKWEARKLEMKKTTIAPTQ